MKPIIFIAPPAAGKGTQAKLINHKYNIPQISTGDLLRKAKEEKTKIGNLIRNTMNAGILVDDEIVLNLLSKRIKEKDCDNGYILDGFPRNIEQAEAYNQMIKKSGKELGYVIYLKIDKEIAKKRVLGRLFCPECGKIYNTNSEYLQPPKDNICPCGAQLIKREDDTEEIFNKRFDEYMKMTTPLIKYYEDRKALYVVDSNDSDTDIAFNEICKIIEQQKDQK